MSTSPSDDAVEHPSKLLEHSSGVKEEEFGLDGRLSLVSGSVVVVIGDVLDVGTTSLPDVAVILVESDELKSSLSVSQLSLFRFCFRCLYSRIDNFFLAGLGRPSAGDNCAASDGDASPVCDEISFGLRVFIN